MFGQVIGRQRTRAAVAVVALALLCIGCFSSVSVAKAATIEELQAMITALMAQIAAMQASAGAGSIPVVTSSSTIQIGTPITTTGPIRIRGAAGVHAAFIATQPVGAQGVVVAGPIKLDGYYWYKVDYATGADGWNIASVLRSRTDLPDVLGTLVGYMDGKEAFRTTNSNRSNALTICKSNAHDFPDSVVRCTWRGSEIFVSTNMVLLPRITQLTSPVDSTIIDATITFATPSAGSVAVSGPVRVGTINWGDGTNPETVNALKIEEQVTVHHSHTYAQPGMYTITAIGLDGMTDTKTMSISTLPQPQAKPTVTVRGTNAVLSLQGSQTGVYTIKFAVAAGAQDIYLPGAPEGLLYAGRPFSDDSFLNFRLINGSGVALDGYKLEGYKTLLTTTAKDLGSYAGLVNGLPVYTHSYLVKKGETKEFILTVNYTPTKALAGSYAVALEGPLRYSLDATYHNDDDTSVTISEKGLQTPSLVLGGGVTTPMTLTAPNGGEKWEIGVTNTVTWTPYGYNPDVNPAKDVTAYLETKNPDGSFKVLGKVQESGKASIHWPTGELNSQTSGGNYVPAGSGYYIRVVNNVTGATDRSDRPFTLIAKPVDIKVNGSDGPVVVGMNQKVKLSWNATGVESCEIDNAYGDTSRATQIGSVPLSGTVDAYLHTEPLWGPTLYCHKSDGSSVYDSVSRTAAPSVTPTVLRVVSPNGGEKLDPAQGTTVKYEAQGISSLSFALYKNNMWKAWIAKDLNIQADPTLSADFIPANLVAGLGEGDNAGDIFKIYITGRKADGTGFMDDKSDQPFGFTTVATKPTPRFNGLTTPTDSLVVTVSAVFKNPTVVKNPAYSGGQTTTLGHINWGDDTKDTALTKSKDKEAFVTLTHTYRSAGNYTLRLYGIDGAISEHTITLGGDLATTSVAYGLSDVQSVTVRAVDPLPRAVDDEYALYTITLKSGKVYTVKSNAFVPASYRELQFRKTGYTGDIASLTAMATVVKSAARSAYAATTGVVLGASTDIYSEIANMLAQIRASLATLK